MNPAYRDMIRARVAGALGESSALRAINHDGVVGALRETVIRQLLEPLLPGHMAANAGIVTCFSGEQSQQCDIVIYDRRLLPPILVAESGLFPIEAVLACIEIKSCLNITELRKAQACAMSVLRLPMMSGVLDEHERPLFDGARRPLTALFAFDTDLTKKLDVERYVDLCAETKAPAMIDLLCVVGSGCWIDSPEGWVSWCGDDHEEIIGFLTCLSNTLPIITATRGEPRLGMYLGKWGPRVYWQKEPAKPARQSEKMRNPKRKTSR